MCVLKKIYFFISFQNSQIIKRKMNRNISAMARSNWNTTQQRSTAATISTWKGSDTDIV